MCCDAALVAADRMKIVELLLVIWMMFIVLLLLMIRMMLIILNPVDIYKSNWPRVNLTYTLRNPSVILTTKKDAVTIPTEHREYHLGVTMGASFTIAYGRAITKNDFSSNQGSCSDEQVNEVIRKWCAEYRD